MSKSLTINGITYSYPSANEDPNWGEDASAWASGVTNALGSLIGAGDILQTTFNIANNVAAPANITGLAFDTGSVREASIQYSIYRISTANPSGNTESGKIELVYDNSAGAGFKWSVSQQANGSSGVIFNITDSGQMTYTSTDINATGYSGVLKFKATALGQ